MTTLSKGNARGLDTLSIIGGALVLLLILASDPYTYGSTGGDSFILNSSNRVPWQVFVSVLDAALLLSVMVSAVLGMSRRTRQFMVAETVWFVLANCVYVYRDGIARFNAVWSARLFWLLLASFACRILLLLLLFQRTRVIRQT